MMSILTVSQWRTMTQTPASPPTDETVQLALNRYTGLIEGYTGRVFSLSTRCETHYPGPNGQVNLNVYPVNDVTSISIDGVESTDLGEWYVHKAAGIITPLVRPFFGRKVVVVYSAGYADAPSEIKTVLATLVEGFIAGVTGGLNEVQGVKKETVFGVASMDYGDPGTMAVAYGTPYAELGSYVSVLEKYREPGVC